jgi:hypothetical protein
MPLCPALIVTGGRLPYKTALEPAFSERTQGSGENPFGKNVAQPE